MTLKKNIYLLRHATSPSAMNTSDSARPLSKLGGREAESIGQICIKSGYNIDFILCSSAVRTRQTCDHVIAQFPHAPQIAYHDSLYHGSIGDYFANLQSLKPNINNVLVIGHNPIIPAFAGFLSDIEKSDLESVQSLNRAYYPGTLSCIEVETENWADLQPNSGKLIRVIPPEPDA